MLEQMYQDTQETRGDKIDTQSLYEYARKRAHQLRDFYIHASMYVLVNIFLIALNMLTSPDHLWFYWALLGWGIGLAAHALTVFGVVWGQDWEERKIHEIMERVQQRMERYDFPTLNRK
jgi:hypothetical protein